FVNLVVIRSDLSGNPSFREALRRVWEATMSAYDHDELPFEQLVEVARADRRPGRNPLFQVAFQLQRYARDWELDGVSVSRLPCRFPGTAVDLELRLWEDGQAIGGGLIYSPDLFEPETIRRMAGHYATLLEGIADDADAPIGVLPVMTADELHQTLVAWNDTAAEYPRERCVHGLFEDQVARNPEAIAVVDADGVSLTYRELNARANQLAHHLRSGGVADRARVGVCLARSHELIASLLAILKAGGAYVPLDPSYPESRLRYLLRDAGVS